MKTKTWIAALFDLTVAVSATWLIFYRLFGETKAGAADVSLVFKFIWPVLSVGILSLTAAIITLVGRAGEWASFGLVIAGIILVYSGYLWFMRSWG